MDVPHNNPRGIYKLKFSTIYDVKMFVRCRLFHCNAIVLQSHFLKLNTTIRAQIEFAIIFHPTGPMLTLPPLLILTLFHQEFEQLF